MAEQCSAHHDDDKQCRATTRLTRVRVVLKEHPYGSLRLPDQVTILLCRKHFAIRGPEERTA